MTNEENQPGEFGERERHDHAADHPKIANESRRRFGKSGLAASGVILTLASQQGMAALTCKSPSGSLSGNLKSHHGPAPTCSGRSPGYWKKDHGDWPVPQDTLFGSVFSCGYNSPYASCTLMTMLSHKDFDANNLGMHLVAAFLNARKGWTPFLTEITIKAMFAEWQANGYFSPTATVQWNAAQIVTYLTSTQG